MDAGQLILIGGGLALLCGVLFILSTIFQVLGIVFNLLGGILELFVNLFNLGPIPGCGCVMAVIGIGLCGMLIYFVVNLNTTCGGPTPVNFCMFFGR